VWAQIKDEVSSPTDEDFLANVEFVEDPTLQGVDEATIVAGFARRYPHQYQHPVLFVADAVTMSGPDHPLLVVNLNDTVPCGPFRTTPRQVQAIENNLSTANMDFSEFAGAVDPAGVFRGF